MVEQVFEAVGSNIGIQIGGNRVEVVLGVALRGVVFVADIRIDTAWNNVWT